MQGRVRWNRLCRVWMGEAGEWQIGATTPPVGGTVQRVSAVEAFYAVALGTDTVEAVGGFAALDGTDLFHGGGDVEEAFGIYG